jgi:Protein of unknown function (DUF3551)
MTHMQLFALLVEAGSKRPQIGQAARRRRQDRKYLFNRFCGGGIPDESRAAQRLEITMKTIHKLATASAVAFSAFAFVALTGSAAQAGPITPPGKYCLTYDLGGSDCSFTSYAECQATASGEGAECYGDTVRDDRLAAYNSIGRKH